MALSPFLSQWCKYFARCFSSAWGSTGKHPFSTSVISYGLSCLFPSKSTVANQPSGPLDDSFGMALQSLNDVRQIGHLRALRLARAILFAQTLQKMWRQVRFNRLVDRLNRMKTVGVFLKTRTLR